MAAKKDDTPAPDEATESTALAASQTGTDLLDSEEDDFFSGAGEGLEDFEQSDMLIPYVRIIQALSKEVQKNHAKYIKGAEQGFFVNSATRKLMDGEKGFLAIPVSFGHRYMAWKPNNGGPAHDYGDDPTVYNATPENEKRKRIDADGNELVDAMQYFVILVDEETGEYEMAVLNFAASQAKKGRGWASTINNRMERHPGTGKTIRPAIYFYSYKITTQPESNDQGSWYGFLIEEGAKVKDLPNGKEIFTQAKQLRERITAGEVKAAVENPADDDNDGTTAF